MFDIIDKRFSHWKMIIIDNNSIRTYITKIFLQCIRLQKSSGITKIIPSYYCDIHFYIMYVQVGLLKSYP